MRIPIQDWGGCVDNGVATLRCIPVVLGNLIAFFVMFSAVIALFFIVFSGVKFITSQGDPQAVDSAKKTMTYAVIGLVFIILSFFILTFLSQVTGVEQIKTPSF